MAGATPELSLATAVDADDNADYLTISLANSLRTVDALFNNVTGHNHGAAHQGGPITSVPASALPPITSAMIADATIQTADLADGAVTSAKIADGSIVAADLQDGNVTTPKIGDGAVTFAKLGAGACTGIALGPDVVKTTDPMFTPWIDFNFVVTQGGTNPTWSNRIARYRQIGKVMHVQFYFNFNGVGSAGATIGISTLPGPPRSSGYLGLGTFVFLHAGVFRGGTCLSTDGVSVVFLIDNNNNFLGGAPSLAIASGDQLGGTLMYEVN